MPLGADLTKVSNRIFGLDLMRACAVIGVMYLHSGYLLGHRLPRGGDAAMFGLETFFVLSGFLIGSTALGMFFTGASPGRVKDFLSRRWLRTLPAYYAFLFINLWLSHRPFDWRFIFFLQTMDGKEPLPYFNESWSLAVEEWFYVILPVALLLMARYAPKRPVSILVGFIFASIVARYILLGPLNVPWRDTYHITLLRLDSIMFGVIAAYLKQRYQGEWDQWKWPCLAAGLILLTWPLSAQPAPAWVNATVYPRYALGAALALPALSSWRDCVGFFSAPIRGVALISYSLYLTHLPMASFLKQFGYITTGDGSLKIICIWLASSLVFATGSYFLIERTGLRFRSKRAHSDAVTVSVATPVTQTKFAEFQAPKSHLDQRRSGPAQRAMSDH